MFYVEPVSTFDPEVFVVMPEQGGLLALSPIYDARRERGAVPSKANVSRSKGCRFGSCLHTIRSWKKRLSRPRTFSTSKPRHAVLRVENLVAICLQTGLAKDRDLVRLFREEAPIDEARLSEILGRHGLEESASGSNRSVRQASAGCQQVRRRLAALPWPEKVRILVRMQKMIVPIVRDRDPRARVGRIYGGEAGDTLDNRQKSSLGGGRHE